MKVATLITKIAELRLQAIVEFGKIPDILILGTEETKELKRLISPLLSQNKVTHCDGIQIVETNQKNYIKFALIQKGE